MKKGLFFIAALLAVGTVTAQQITNRGFEDWTDFGAYEDPNHWTSINLISLFGGPITSSKSTDAHSGDYALETKTVVSDFGTPGEFDTIQGIVMLGTTDLSGGSMMPGAAFPHRPDSLVGWYKLTSPNNSPCFINSVLSGWNNNTREVIGSIFFAGDSTSTYRRFNVPVHYSSNELPDTLSVFIMNSMDNASGLNNVLLIDNLEVHLQQHCRN